jgi:hypothetical protein
MPGDIGRAARGAGPWGRARVEHSAVSGHKQHPTKRSPPRYAKYDAPLEKHRTNKSDDPFLEEFDLLDAEVEALIKASWPAGRRAPSIAGMTQARTLPDQRTMGSLRLGWGPSPL